MTRLCFFLVIVSVFVFGCSPQLNTGETSDQPSIQKLSNPTDNAVQSESGAASSFDPQFITQTATRTRVLVTFKEGQFDPKVIENASGTVIQELTTLGVISAWIPTSQLDKVKKHPSVELVEEDKVIDIEQENVSWGVTRVNSEKVWNTPLTGKGINIAVIDTGIDVNHEDLNVVGGKSLVSYTTSYDDDNGHGTHVAGIISAKHNGIGIKGVSPDANIYAVKVLNYDGVGYMSDTIAGVDWAIKNNMKILNLSIGNRQSSSTLERILRDAYNQGIFIVAASGNEGESGEADSVNYPAKYDTTIAVGATDDRNQIAPFSSFGPAVELSAPGVNIASTYLDNQYVYMDGTSMATPFVTGILALTLEMNPKAPASEIRSYLQNNVMDLGETGRDVYYGFGLLQAPIQQKLFTDVAGTWAEGVIQFVSEKGWMNGTSMTTFSPNTNLTRAQAAVVLVKALQLQDIEGPEPTYKDISSRFWAYNEIMIATKHGIFKGKADGSFDPNSPLTREQMAAVMYQFLNEMNEPSQNPFTDISEQRWSYKPIVTVAQTGLFKGYQDNTFRPMNKITRAQFAAVLKNWYDKNNS